MAKKLDPEAAAAANEKKKLTDEKKKLKDEQKQQRKEAKKRAKEIAKQEEELEEEERSGLLTFFATIFIVAVWLAVICVVIKLDVGGFGSNVLTPILKNVPVINKILPNSVVTDTSSGDGSGEFNSLKEAQDYIRQLELELERAQNESNSKNEDITNLKAEVVRLQEFEKKQVEFQRIQTEFYEEVIYADKGPGAEAYKKYYEAMDPATAEYLYKQVVAQLQEDSEVLAYASAYAKANMKPKQAAAIIEAMTDNLDLAARILNAMSAEDRGAILGVMNSDVAAKLTKIMDPES